LGPTSYSDKFRLDMWESSSELQQVSPSAATCCSSWLALSILIGIASSVFSHLSAPTPSLFYPGVILGVKEPMGHGYGYI